MNANELARELESVPAYRNTPMFQRAATMLRQQQAREDSLCSMVKEYQDKVDELRSEIEMCINSFEQIATGSISGEPDNYKDMVYVMQKIASDALNNLRKVDEK